MKIDDRFVKLAGKIIKIKIITGYFAVIWRVFFVRKIPNITINQNNI